MPTSQTTATSNPPHDHVGLRPDVRARRLAIMRVFAAAPDGRAYTREVMALLPLQPYVRLDLAHLSWYRLLRCISYSGGARCFEITDKGRALLVAAITRGEVVDA